MSDAPTIERASQFKDTPSDQQRRWTMEIDAAEKALRDFHEQGTKVVKEFLGERGEEVGRKRLNLYYSDVTTRAAYLSGMPRVRVKRRFADAKDDVARVSAETLERLLNTDVERDSDGFRTALAEAKGDWLRPGLGVMRFRYVVETETTPEQPPILDEGGNELAPAVPGQEVKTFEDVETDYVHWRDVLWSPCRVWSEIRWIAFRSEITRDQATERFGEPIAKRLPTIKKPGDEEMPKEAQDAWARIEVWEIWCKDSKEVYWFVKGHDGIVDTKPDPLGLPGFFPCPRPLMANLTTTKCVPRATYFLAEDLYNEVHELTTRIRWIVRAIKVAGVYDKANEGVKRVLDEALENELIPVENFAAFTQRGGMEGAIDFLPIEAMVNALVQLVAQRNLVKQDLYEVTGQSDIMRGQAAQKATATEQRIKARFGSTRIQAEQEEFTRFASEAQRIRGYIICKMFDPETIAKRSNIMAGNHDPALIQQGIQLLKNFDDYRVEVDSESLSMTDFDAVQQESVQFMQATSEFFQRWTPLIQAGGPAIGQFALELYQVFASGLRGAEKFESIVDRAVEQLKQLAAQPKPPPPPDPRMETEKIKAGSERFKAQADMAQTGMDLKVKQAEHAMAMQKMAAQAAMPRRPNGDDDAF